MHVLVAETAICSEH